MINISDSSQCCGCTACASICNHDAIFMKPDKLGFKYPFVDKEKCIDCGLCDKVCAFNDNYDQSLQFSKPLAYAVRHKDIKELETSRSGAAFVALSDIILEQGGVVYGAAFDEQFNVYHKRTTTKSQRDKLKGSKYVQSDLGCVFREIRNDLINGRLVMFSGTGCQCAGLHSFIGKQLRKNLYIVDIICHGVPSPIVWHDYLSYMKKKKGEKIISVNFRDKSKNGWKDHWESLTFNSGKKYSRLFTELFYRDICLRPSCGECHYCNFHRPSDLTLGDYWGYERTSVDFNKDNKGCSLVLINTELGKSLFEQSKRHINYIKCELPNVTQKHLLYPVSLRKSTKLFATLYPHLGFIATNTISRIITMISDLPKKFVIFLKKSKNYLLYKIRY